MHQLIRPFLRKLIVQVVLHIYNQYSCYTLARLPPISLTYLLCCNTTVLFLYLIYTFFACFATGS